MIHEMRIYHTAPGRMPVLLNRFETITLAIWERFNIRQVGFWTVEIGNDNADLYYLLEWESMAERERMMSSFVGEGFAIPHGTDTARALVRRATLAFLQFPEGIDWDGEEVRVCVAIAATEGEHIGVMSSLAQILLDPDQAEALRTATDPDTVLTLLTPDPDEDEDT